MTISIFTDDYRALRERLQQSLSALRQVVAQLRDDELPAEITAPLRQAIDGIAGAWQAIQETLQDVSTKIPVLAGDTARTLEARQSDIAELLNEARSEVDSAMASAAGGVDGLISRLQRRLLPPRPAATDIAGQEASIAGRKSDLKMMLDGLPSGELRSELKGMLEAARNDDDELTVYILGGTDWPVLYLRSRGQDGDAGFWSSHDVAEVLRFDDEQRSLTSALSILTGRYGLNGCLMMLESFIRAAFDDLRPETLARAPW